MNKLFKDPAKKFFNMNVTDRDRAIFEGGITLGALYHQFQGTPFKNDEKIIRSLEKSIENTMKCQPYVQDIQVKIKIPEKQDQNSTNKNSTDTPYNYLELNGSMFDVKLEIKYNKVKILMKLEHNKELNFPLMYIKEISE